MDDFLSIKTQFFCNEENKISNGSRKMVLRKIVSMLKKVLNVKFEFDFQCCHSSKKLSEAFFFFKSMSILALIQRLFSDLFCTNRFFLCCTVKSMRESGNVGKWIQSRPRKPLGNSNKENVWFFLFSYFIEKFKKIGLILNHHNFYWFIPEVQCNLSHLHRVTLHRCCLTDRTLQMSIHSSSSSLRLLFVFEFMFVEKRFNIKKTDNSILNF